jgi:hypothetical protein
MLSMYNFIAVMVCPDGAPATAWKLTGEATVAPVVGEQIVTTDAVGVQLPVEVVTVIDSIF